MHAVVHCADIQDRDGGILAAVDIVRQVSVPRKTVRRQRISRADFADALAKFLPRVEVEIVKRCDHAKGFVLLPQRWIVERSIAWLNRCRRLAKDWENLNLSALIFLRFASIRLMLESSVILDELSRRTLRVVTNWGLFLFVFFPVQTFSILAHGHIDEQLKMEHHREVRTTPL